MRHTVVLVTLLLVGGCDKLFDLDHISAGGKDGSVDDGPRPIDDVAFADALDGGRCDQDGPDEDGDGIVDDCDACPTVASNRSLDEDADDLPDACDPNLATGGDRILFAATFADPIDPSKLQLVGGTQDPANDGQVSLGPNALLRTLAAFEPTKVEVRLAGIGGVDVTSTTTLTAGVVSCRVGAGGCAGSTATTCLTALPGGSPMDAPSAPANLALLELIQADTAECHAGTGGSFGESAPTMNVSLGVIGLATNTTGTAVVESIVVYGAL